MSPAPLPIAHIPINATIPSATNTIAKVKSLRDTSQKILSGGTPDPVATHNIVTGLQNKDLYQKSWNFAKDTSKQVCSSPISGGKGKRKRTRKRKRTYRHKKTKHKRSTRRSCKCRKTRRRRRKSYKKKRR